MVSQFWAQYIVFELILKLEESSLRVIIAIFWLDYNTQWQIFFLPFKNWAEDFLKKYWGTKHKDIYLPTTIIGLALD